MDAIELMENDSVWADENDIGMRWMPENDWKMM